jgi:hypothetical protein
MQGQLSNKHHYVPQFLIKKFADENEKVWVYNKQNQRFEKAPKSPAAVFYEPGRNLFDVNGKPGDNVEKMYGDVDTLLAKTLDKILSTDTMTGQELTLMIYLVSLMKWRVPKVDDMVKDLVKSVQIEDLGMKIRPIDPNVISDPAAIDRLQNLEIIQEVKRLLLMVQPLYNQEGLGEIHKNCYILTHNGPPSLLGDSMIIEEPNSDYKTLGNFVFPLSHNKTLICKRNGKKEYPHDIFPFWKDLATFHLSEQRVACQSKDYLQSIINMYAQLEGEGKTKRLTKYIFDLLS